MRESDKEELKFYFYLSFGAFIAAMGLIGLFTMIHSEAFRETGVFLIQLACIFLLVGLGCNAFYLGWKLFKEDEKGGA